MGYDYAELDNAGRSESRVDQRTNSIQMPRADSFTFKFPPITTNSYSFQQNKDSPKGRSSEVPMTSGESIHVQPVTQGITLTENRAKKRSHRTADDLAADEAEVVNTKRARVPSKRRE